MKKFVAPEVDVQSFEVEDVITVSGEDYTGETPED